MPSPHGIHAIDTLFQKPAFCTAYLVVENGRGAFVDTGTRHSLPQHLAALEAAGLAPEDVDWVVLTHVHLDHAGGAGALMAVLPNARLVVHPRGARHMVDPSRLVAGATAVYGEEEIARSYGEVVPVPAERIVEAPDGHVVDLAGRALHCFDTPGHARHHLSVWDPASGSVFAGDAFGLSYREFDRADGTPWIVPTTSPVQFEPGPMIASIRRILGHRPAAIHLGHYGAVTDGERLGDLLVVQVERMAALAREAMQRPEAERAAWLQDALEDFYFEQLRAHDPAADRGAMRAQLAGDIVLNAQGLLIWAARAAEEGRT